MIAIIGGTGVDLRGTNSLFAEARDEKIHTRWGAAHVTRALLKDADGSNETEVIFLHRHADPDGLSGRVVPPHCINYRANIAALKVLGVTGILASTAVGTLNPDLAPGSLALLDDFIDYTTNRAKTFFDERAVHVDMTHPYCAHLRTLLRDQAAELGIPLRDGATYICADGPRFETAAEIRAFRMWGADVVGMTGVPEASLAREASMSYAGLSIATNWAAGINPNALTHGEVLENMRDVLPKVAQLFLAAARAYRDDPTLPSRNATQEFATAEYNPDTIFGAV